MAFVATTFKLDLTPGASRPVIYASAGDIGRPFTASLYWNGEAWTATGTTAKIRGKKPDKTVFEYTATVNGSSVTFSTTEQMTIIGGPVECELVFTSGNDVVASANFVIIVEDSPYNPDALSESDVNTLAELVSDQIPPAVGDWLEDNVGVAPTKTVIDGAVSDWLDDNGISYATVGDAPITSYSRTGGALWENGAWRINGEPVENSARIRNIDYFPYNVRTVSCTSDYSFTVGAWENGEYKGYLKSGYIINLSTSNILFVDTFSIATLRQKYPGYKFKILAKNTAGTDIDPGTAKDSFTIEYYDYINKETFEAVESRTPLGLSPNIIFQCRNIENIPPYTKWYVQAAANNQYDRVRFNVRKTTDGYYFLCHDDTINNEARNPGGSTIGTSISANGQSLATLNSYDWGIKYGAKYAGLTVPMLEDALKFSALFNIGVTLEYATSLALTDADIANTLALCDKYGITDNLIVIHPAAQQIPMHKKFVDHNPHISCLVGGSMAAFTDEYIEQAKANLQTPYNKLYVQPTPWGTVPTDEFISLMKSNNFVLYNASPMTQSALLTESMFSHGYGLIEANNVYNIKDTVRSWANSLVDG